MGKVRTKSGWCGEEVGTWVSYEDYKKLEAQLAEVLKEGTFDGWDLGSAINRLDELEAQLAEAINWIHSAGHYVECGACRHGGCDCGKEAIINREKQDAGT